MQLETKPRKQSQTGNEKTPEPKHENKMRQKNAYKIRELTKREKAAIIWGIVTGCQDWNEIYLLAKSQDPDHDETNKKTLREYASKWKHTAAVVQYYNEQNEIYLLKYDAARAAAANAGNSEEETEEGNETGKDGNKKHKTPEIDLIATDNALKELNRLANEIQDPIKRADAIQAIQKIKITTASDDEKRPDLQRFYTPLSCRGCKLYEEAQKAPENA